MIRTPWLSKSRIQSGRQCHKRLWLELHLPKASQWSTSAQARLDEGTRFGDLARELLGGGVLVSADHFHAAEALAETAALLARPRVEVPMLFEPAFAYQGVRVRVDGFQRDEGEDTLIEVKSTTSVKAEHVWDCAIQTWVARGAGRNVTRILHGHVDTGFTYRAEGDYRGLLKLVDITAEVEALLPQIAEIVEQLKGIAVGPMPNLGTGNACFVPYECPFLGHCRASEPAGPEFPLELLPRGQGVIGRLAELGYSDLCTVPDEELANPIHQRVAQATRTGVPFVSSELRQLLADIAFPRSYLDFETITFVVPRWLGTRPFQQLPFQFSLHTESIDGQIRHDAFLDISGQSPLLGFVERLLEVIAESGPVIVWNQAFEATRLRELANLFPQYASSLMSIVGRMVDLLPIYRRHYYHRDMRGSWSIKSVLPTVAPELDYSTLDVADGGEAQSAYLKAMDLKTSEEERVQLRAQMLEYCQRDTFAMVRLANAFVPGTLAY